MYLKASNPWNPGYALPGNVMDEPFARGTITTRYTPRRTISSLSPGEFVGLEGLGSLGGHTLAGSTLAGSTLAGSSLAGSTLGGPVGAAGDPVAAFGRDAARLVMQRIMTVEPAVRKPLMKTILDSIESGMYAEVETKAEAYAKKYPPAVALEKGLAAAFANRFLAQVIKVGKTGQAPTGGLLGLAGCGACGACGAQADLAGFWDTVYKYSGAKAVVGASKTVGAGAYGVGKSIVKGIGSLACKAANSGGLAAVATAAGGPAGAGGAAIAGAVCTKEQLQQQQQEQQSFLGGGSMLPMLLLGGGALALVLVATRRGGKR
jgi:hypothetical protein